MLYGYPFALVKIKGFLSVLVVRAKFIVNVFLLYQMFANCSWNIQVLQIRQMFVKGSCIRI